jgi:YfiH family protein
MIPLSPGNDWMAPTWSSGNVAALMTTRSGGVSVGPFASMNLGLHVGDDAARVLHNRGHLDQALGARAVYLEQVHGNRVVVLDDDMASSKAESGPIEADASVSVVPGLACVVMVADCLPVLFATLQGTAVAAAHAGWRGLAAGVLENTVRVLGDQARCEPAQMQAWLGPCIGAGQFEVGPEVVEACLRGADDAAAARACFKPSSRAGHWLADLAGLAELRLRALGLKRVEVLRRCTVEDSGLFSYRRDGVTGRMGAAICLRAGG